MIRHRLVIGLSICLLALFTISCSSHSGKWYKPGVSQATFSRDKADCEDAIIGAGTTEVANEVYSVEACLERRGYTQVPEAPE